MSTLRPHQRHQHGFTIIELLIIMIVTGAIAGVALMSAQDLRSRSHNSERQRDVTTMQRALENYYSQKEKYPSLDEINNADWRSKNLKNVTDDVLTDPQSKIAQLVGAPKAKAYSYQPTAPDNSACDNSTKDCMKYVLTATQEGGEAYRKTNFN